MDWGPGEAVDGLSALSLLEVGVDITDQQPRPVTAVVLAADMVVIGSEAGVGPELVPAAAQLEPGTRIETWVTDEPSTRGTDSIGRMRLVRDDIADLRDRLLTPPAS